MLDHVSRQARDVDAATAFYLSVFAALGFRDNNVEAVSHG
jgi:hypothetical protein